MSKAPNQYVAAILSDVRSKQAEAIAIIEAEYPAGLSVTVHHHRGSFAATVAAACGRYGYDLGYVIVRNDATGKTSKRFYDDLERNPYTSGCA